MISPTVNMFVKIFIPYFWPGLGVYTSSDRIYLSKHHSVDWDNTMARRRSGRGCSGKHRDNIIPASAQGRGQHPPSSSSIAMYNIEHNEYNEMHILLSNAMQKTIYQIYNAMHQIQYIKYNVSIYNRWNTIPQIQCLK